MTIDGTGDGTGDGRATDGRTAWWCGSAGAARGAAGRGGMAARTTQSSVSAILDKRVLENSAEPATWWVTFLKKRMLH